MLNGSDWTLAMRILYESTQVFANAKEYTHFWIRKIIVHWIVGVVVVVVVAEVDAAIKLYKIFQIVTTGIIIIVIVLCVSVLRTIFLFVHISWRQLRIKILSIPCEYVKCTCISQHRLIASKLNTKNMYRTHHTAFSLKFMTLAHTVDETALNAIGERRTPKLQYLCA